MNALSLRRGIAEVSKRLFRPWLEYKWIRKFTEHDRIVQVFRKVSNDVVNSVSAFSITARLRGW